MLVLAWYYYLPKFCKIRLYDYTNSRDARSFACGFFLALSCGKKDSTSTEKNRLGFLRFEEVHELEKIFMSLNVFMIFFKFTDSKNVHAFENINHDLKEVHEFEKYLSIQKYSQILKSNHEF